MTKATDMPGFWTANEAARIREEGRRVIVTVESGAFPFDGTWCDFQADPSWLIPRPPSAQKPGVATRPEPNRTDVQPVDEDRPALAAGLKVRHGRTQFQAALDGIRDVIRLQAQVIALRSRSRPARALITIHAGTGASVADLRVFATPAEYLMVELSESTRVMTLQIQDNQVREQGEVTAHG